MSYRIGVEKDLRLFPQLQSSKLIDKLRNTHRFFTSYFCICETKSRAQLESEVANSHSLRSRRKWSKQLNMVITAHGEVAPVGSKSASLKEVV